MASRLRQIYAALANRAIMLNGKNIPCRKLDETNGVIDVTPVRVLSPLSERAEGSGLVPLTFGGAATLQWKITELCLIASVEEGSGLEFFTPLLVECQEAYVNNVYADRHLGLDPKTVTLNNLDIDIGVHNYPLGSSHWYYSVKAEWTIRENL